MTSLDIALKIKQRVNKKDTSDYENIPIYEIVEAYNKAQYNIIHKLYGQNNIYKQGVEATRKRIDDLKNLLNKEPLELLVTKKGRYHISNSLPSDYLHYINSTSLASNTNCSSKIIRNILQEESNINTINNNEELNASFEWGEVPVTIVDNNIKIHTIDRFNISKIYLTYLHYPRSIDIVGYKKQDGSMSTNINPEIPDYIVEMCIDEAARIIQGDIQNEFGYQVSNQNVNSAE